MLMPVKGRLMTDKKFSKYHYIYLYIFFYVCLVIFVLFARQKVYVVERYGL